MTRTAGYDVCYIWKMKYSTRIDFIMEGMMSLKLNVTKTTQSRFLKSGMTSFWFLDDVRSHLGLYANKI